MATNKKFDFESIERVPDNQLKWAIGTTAALVLSYMGWIGLGGFISMVLTLFIWWSFGRYFEAVGDEKTAKWVKRIMIVLAFYGASSFLFTILFDFGVLVSLSSGSLIFTLFIILFVGVIASSVVVFLGCIRMLRANKHHSFALKRIAVAAAFAVPLLIIVGSVKSITFIGQIGEFIYEYGRPDDSPPMTLDGDYFFSLSTGSVGAAESMLGDIASFVLSPIIFIYKVIIVSPYVFLLMLFYRMYKRNALKPESIEP